MLTKTVVSLPVKKYKLKISYALCTHLNTVKTFSHQAHFYVSGTKILSMG